MRGMMSLALHLLLTPRSQKGLAEIRIRIRRQNFRPFAYLARLPEFLGLGFSIPANLLDRMVELDAVAIWIEYVSGIVNAWMKLRWDRFSHFNPMIFEKLYGIAQLSIVSELQSKRRTGRVWAKAQTFSERHGKQPERMMLGVAAQE